ncbi:Cofilin/tropomyosin-type actin-binding protein [Gracilaria domingensis]|nr:Cofilin/tropomyosin-type actin-binding protein [Gracilaria domingensis]
MASGVAVDGKVVTGFKGIMSRQHRAAVFKINDTMTEVQLEKTIPLADGAAQPNWEAFTKQLPDTDCRYVAYDFVYEHQGANKNRVLFILWSPQDSKVRSKMIYASSQEGVTKQLDGVQRSLQITDRDELEYAEISKKLAQHTAGY